MELRDLILLTDEESKIAIEKGLRGELEIFIIDTARNLPHLLRIGELDEIRQAIPERTIITLDPPPSGTSIPRYGKAGYLDLRITKNKYEEIFKEKSSWGRAEKKRESLIPGNIDLLKNEYYLRLTVMAKEAVYNYSMWKTTNSIGKNMMSLVVEPLLKKITSDVREIEFLKRILKSEFEEL